AAIGLALAPIVRAWLADEPVTAPSDFEHALDLLRRAHGGTAGWAVGLVAGDFPFGAGLLLPPSDAGPREAGAVADELRRLVAGMRLAQLHEPGEQPG